ncbi:MAG: sodium:solute symporter [Bacteroidales bacterium]|nr:sodium:solute symporter [Bacteroidales bacterium]
MTPTTILLTILAYFAAMYAVSLLSGRRADNAAFFSGGHGSRWWVVALAMVSACMSGVTFVSVPGMVGVSGFGYLQMCIGFFLGYLVIAFVLTPLYFRLGVVSIYQYLEQRFGLGAYRTGAWFFFISKMLGASVRLFLLCLTLQLLVFGPWGVPFWINALCNVAVCLLYTYRGGVRSVIWTDVLKTGCMLLAVTLCLYFIARDLGGIRIHEQTFFFDDVNHPQYFWKQLVGGLFTVVAMTGLDQDMMQRTLACKNVRDSQKNLVVSSLLQAAVIALFLCLGALLYQYAAVHGIAETGDRLFPAVATEGSLPAAVGILFIIGLVSSAYGAGGSALTSLTTSFSVDILGTKGRDEAVVTRTRKRVHWAMAAGMALTITVFNAVNSTSAIDAVYKLASYTYGPILGLFSFGILTRAKVRDRYVPIVALAAPVICFILQMNAERWFGGYHFSYELLLLNAGLTFLGLTCLIERGPRPQEAAARREKR